MKIKKYHIQKAVGLSMIAALTLSQGCKKSFLNTTAASANAANFWKTSADASAAVTAMYADQYSYNEIAFPSLAIESMGSDDVTKGSVPTDASFMNEYIQFTVTAGEGQLEGFWQGVYGNINFANQVLVNVPNINMDASLKARYLAEAQFMRAYDYFRLVRAFGSVPLRLTPPTSTTQYNLAQSTASAVYAQIEKDLTAAASILPASYDAADIGHVTKGAALTLHAKVALYQKHWADAISYTTQVSALGYSLYPTYDQIFRTTNKNNSESIFEIQCALIPNNPAASNSQYSQVQYPRVSIAPTGANGWGFNDPSPSLISEFEANDPRLLGTVISAGETTPEGDVIPTSAPDPYYNRKSYVAAALYNSAFNVGCQEDKIVLRYADVLLMNAEANAQSGNTSAALASLEKVRARARANAIANGAPAGTLPAVTTTDQSALLAAIYHERRVELGMEFERHFDVIRWGLGASVFGKIPLSKYTTGKSELWPIPQQEIDNSGGLIKQNPGY